jgi:hypothetical protein
MLLINCYFTGFLKALLMNERTSKTQAVIAIATTWANRNRSSTGFQICQSGHPCMLGSLCVAAAPSFPLQVLCHFTFSNMYFRTIGHAWYCFEFLLCLNFQHHMPWNCSVFLEHVDLPYSSLYRFSSKTSVGLQICSRITSSASRDSTIRV